MNRKLIKPLLIAVIAIVVIIVAILIVKNYMLDEKKPTSLELFKTIEHMYDGEIISYEYEQDEINIVLQRNARNYAIVADSQSGEVLQMKDITNTSTILSVKEVKEKLQKKYGDSIITMDLSEEKNKINYYVDIQFAGQQKYLVVDAKTGEIISEDRNKKVNKSLISKNEAKKIAENASNGKYLTIQFIQSTSGGYYLVTIKKASKITVVQVHAMSGEIISTTMKEETE